MFNFKKLAVLLLAVVLAVWLVGCEENVDTGEEGTEVIITVTKDTGTGVYNYKYFSLEQGIELPETVSNTQEWDLRFKAAWQIMTNSGETAVDLSSSGVGGVVFTGSTDFGVSVDTGTLDYGVDRATDVKYWITGMAGPAETLTNLMSFPGYDDGDGSAGDPYSGANYGQVQYFDFSTHTFVMKDRVYVVKHGDGAGYSKVKLMSVEYSNVGTVWTYVFRFRYENID